MLWTNPLGLLYFNGGEQGVWVALLAVALYLFYRMKKDAVSPSLYMYGVLGLFLVSFAIYQPLWALYTKKLLLFRLFSALCAGSLFVWLDKLIKQPVYIKERKEHMKKWIVITVLISLVGFGWYDYATKPTNSLKDNPASQLPIGINEQNIAPNFTLKTLDGQTVKLSDFRGKKVILNFWATWCPPCRAEIPDMQQFYEKHKAEGIEILAVNATETEKSAENIKKFAETYEMTFPILLDEKSNVAHTFQAQTIPTSYIIDTDGVIQKRMIGPMSYEQMKQFISSIK
jgi:peroxiredoxin